MSAVPTATPNRLSICGQEWLAWPASFRYYVSKAFIRLGIVSIQSNWS